MSKCPFSNMTTRFSADSADSKIRTLEYRLLLSNHFGQEQKVEGLFGPGSMHWKIYGCPAVVLGAYSALLLQIAHPAVADGVARFSQFSSDYLGRAERTFTSMIKIYFGDQKTALQSGMKLHNIHNMVRGKIRVVREGKLQEEDYCANDYPHLCWVLSTLVFTSLQVYEIINGPLEEYQREQFFEESKSVASVMGIPSHSYPENLNNFQVYFSDMINGKYLRVDHTTKSLAEVIFDPPLVPSILAKLMAAGFLPSNIRRSFGLKYNIWQRLMFAGLIRFTAIMTWLTPYPFGLTPPYYQALYRIAKHKGVRPRWSTQFFNYLTSYSFFKAVRL